MNKTLKDQLVRAMFRFKKTSVPSPPGINLHMGEFFTLAKIADNCLGSEGNSRFTDIHSKLHVSKPAFSQMLNSLEKKGYIQREIDQRDRRRLVTTLTPEGDKTLQAMKDHADKTITEIISRFGEENTMQLITLFNRFADISEEVERETIPKEIEGEKHD